MAARKSLRDLDNDALGDTTAPPARTPAPAPVPVPAAPARVARPAAAKPAGKPAGKRVTSTIGVYMQRHTFDAARGAYVADLDTLASGPDTFARWVDAALAEYAGLTPAGRTAIAQGLPAQQRTDSRGINRTFQVGQDTIEATNAALVADRQAGRVHSRSEFAVEAILWATEASRVRNGGVLPEAPPRLPNRAMR